MAIRPQTMAINAHSTIIIGDVPVDGSEPPVMPLDPLSTDVVVTPAEAATVVVVTTGFTVVDVVVVAAVVVVVVTTGAVVVVVVVGAIVVVVVGATVVVVVVGAIVVVVVGAIVVVVVGAIVVVVVGATVVVVVGAIVVVVGAIVVVVVGAIVVVVVGAIVVVVVGGVTTPATQVMPDGLSVESTEKVSCAFQYLSSCVADGSPRVHAKPMLYVPAGTTCGPAAPKTPNEMVGIPVSKPGPPGVLATAVVLSTIGDPAPLNNGCRRLAPVPAGNGPCGPKVRVAGSTEAGTM